MTQSVDNALLGQALYAVAIGSPTAVRCTLETADRINDHDLAKHVRDSAEYSRQFGAWFAPFNADFDVQNRGEGNPILETQQQVAFQMMDQAPDEQASDLAATVSLRTALGYWTPLMSGISLLAGKIGRDDIVQIAEKAVKALGEADEAAVKIIREA